MFLDGDHFNVVFVTPGCELVFCALSSVRSNVICRYVEITTVFVIADGSAFVDGVDVGCLLTSCFVERLGSCGLPRLCHGCKSTLLHSIVPAAHACAPRFFASVEDPCFVFRARRGLALGVNHSIYSVG